MRNRLKQLIAIATLLLGGSATAADAPVRVLAYGEHQGNNIVYHYTIINNSVGEGFNNFVIGSEYDTAQDETFPELGALPTGWRYGKQGEFGKEILLDPASTSQPSGWAPSAYGKQEIDFFYLKWRTGTGGVKLGQTLPGFSVAIPKGEDLNLVPMPSDSKIKYITGHFTAGPPHGPDIHGPIERLDTTPPVLNVTVAPATLWPPDGKSVPITVSMSVRDDYDSAPEVKLESITANEPLAEGDVSGAEFGTDDRQFSLTAKRAGANKDGRVYTITYSVTDGSGNKAIASATVVVPHDQGK